MIKYGRVLYKGRVNFARIENDEVLFLETPYWDLENSPVYEEREYVSVEKVSLADVKLQVPLQPGKIVCVGLNYAKHVQELHPDLEVKEPVLFMKPPTAVVGPDEEIVYPLQSRRVDYEGELAVIIGKQLHLGGEEEAEAAIWGYTCANDVTARDLQEMDGQWTRAMGFDTFCPLGPWAVRGLDPNSLNITVTLNGQLKQSSNTKNMLYPVKKLVAFVSQVMTLHLGDVILTGTPEGIGPMNCGDEVLVSIEGIGELKNIIVGQREVD